MKTSSFVRIFVATVGVAALVCLGSLGNGGRWADPLPPLLIVALAIAAGARPVRIPALKTELVATHPFVLCALAEFGPWAGVLTAVGGLSGATLQRAKRPQAIRLLFNTSTVVLTTVIAYWAFRALGGRVGGPRPAVFAPLAGATTAYFVVNTSLVAAVIALERRESPRQVWESHVQWTAISFFAGLTLAAGMLLVLHLAVAPWALVLGIPPVLLFVAYYRSHKERLEEKQRRLSEVEALNVELERTVRELQEALASVESARAKLVREISDRKHAEQALRESEEQLRQSQKMEAVGRLAGGVAHDFNNLLTVITGYSDLLIRRLEDETLRVHAVEVQKAAERAASLTRQLLAFSRRQVLTPKIVDLNAVVDNMDKMLRRVIGEDIELVVGAAPDLGRVRADPGQLEQVILNLAVNARDAMSQGGRLTIETANVDRGTLEAEPRSAAAAYVRLKVTDTGCGMDEATMAHIFEPFFTTKAEGRGTGLGLSMVYGIVQQSGGWITVASQPGQGASFLIFLPQVAGEVDDLAPAEARAHVRGGIETVLLVEDEDQVRDLTREALEMNGYKVFETSNAFDAVEICERHAGPIHLMLTDVVMPRMNGQELYQRLAPLRPEMKVLFMSGYTDRTLLGAAAPGDEIDYLPKPFTLDALAEKVRKVLDRPRH